MILVDTSVWVEHLRRSDSVLARLLEDGLVLTHPMVVDELACGRLPRRDELLGKLRLLPFAPVASDDEALELIESHQLMGRGIGYVDVHLLASTLLADDTRLWTADARLDSAAARMFVSWDPSDR